jgi:hypothetical protein
MLLISYYTQAFFVCRSKLDIYNSTQKTARKNYSSYGLVIFSEAVFFVTLPGNKILVVDHVMPFAVFAESNFLLMEDNARPHVARQVIDYLNAVDIPFMEWLPNCPDLNPIDIEHPWDALEKKVRSRTPPSFNHIQLVNAVIDQWENTPRKLLHI